MTETLQMLIASRLADGRVVFLAAGGRWVENLAAGRVAGNAAEAAELLKAGQAGVAANLVVRPELMPVTERNGTRVPVAYREVIRAGGPTVEARHRSSG